MSQHRVRQLLWIMGRVIGGALVLVVSFTGTLWFLDFWERRLDEGVMRRLNEGKTVFLQFENNSTEDRDNTGNIRCGPETANGYLGMFVAGEKYSVAYESKSHRWTATGPVQTRPYDPKSKTCRIETNSHGPEELREVVVPNNHVLILFGGRYKFVGRDVFMNDSKVGRLF